VNKVLSRTLLVASLVVPGTAFTGCSEPEPKMVDIPANKMPPKDEKAAGAPVPKTNPDGTAYGASKKYQDMMPK
jgi:hypothetical protein